MGEFDLRAFTAQPRFLFVLFVQAVVAFACFAAIVGLRFVRRGAARFWMGPALVALCVLPGVVGAVMAAFAFRDVLAAMALVGSGGVSAVAAGSIESLLPLAIGLVCVGALSLFAVLVVAAGTSRVTDETEPGGPAWSALAAPLVVVSGFAPVLGLLALVHHVNFGSVEPARVMLVWRLVVFGALALALLFVGFVVATVVRAPRGRAPILAKLVPPASLLLAAFGTVVVWLFLFGSFGRLAALATSGPVRTAEQTEGMELPTPVEPEAAPEVVPEETPAPEDVPPVRPTPRPTERPRPVVTRPAREPEAPQAVRVGGAIAEPRKLKNVSPFYPAIAKQARVQGVVILECTIGVDGRVRDVKVLRSIPLLDAAAVEAVRQWVYAPTLLNGAPVPVIMTVTVNFKLS
jgi:TonB family protein